MNFTIINNEYYTINYINVQMPKASTIKTFFTVKFEFMIFNKVISLELNHDNLSILNLI